MVTVCDEAHRLVRAQFFGYCEYSFFDYRVNEALHMTDEEHDILASLMRQMREELDKKPDALQNSILVSYIELALNFCQRFYNRLFVIQLAKNGLAAGETVSQVSDRLGFEYPQHFSRMFKKQEGITPSEYCRRLHY